MLRLPRFIGLSAALLSMGLAAGCNRGDHPQQLSRTAPDFTVHDGSRTIMLSSYRGKTVLLNFWATWCAPCLDELPSLQKLQEQMPGVQVLAVSIDDDPDAYNSFLRQYDLGLLSVRSGSNGANRLFGSVQVPETFVIDRSGIVRRKFVGAQSWTSAEITEYLMRL